MCEDILCKCRYPPSMVYQENLEVEMIERHDIHAHWDPDKNTMTVFVDKHPRGRFVDYKEYKELEEDYESLSIMHKDILCKYRNLMRDLNGATPNELHDKIRELQGPDPCTMKPWTKETWPESVTKIRHTETNKVWEVSCLSPETLVVVRKGSLDEGLRYYRRLTYQHCFNEFTTLEGGPCGS